MHRGCSFLQPFLACRNCPTFWKGYSQYHLLFDFLRDGVWQGLGGKEILLGSSRENLPISDFDFHTSAILIVMAGVEIKKCRRSLEIEPCHCLSEEKFPSSLCVVVILASSLLIGLSVISSSVSLSGLIVTRLW